MAYDLRQQGWSVDFSFSGLASKRLKRAHKIQATWALLWGSEEQKDNSVIVKNLKTGHQEKVSRDQINESLKKMQASS